MAIKWEAGRDWRWGRECGTSWVTTLRVSYLCWRHVKEIRTHPCHCLKFCLTCGLNSFGVQLGFERIGKISVSLFSLQAQEICIGPVACLSHNSLCGYTLFYLLAQIYATPSLSLSIALLTTTLLLVIKVHLGPPASEGKSKTCSSVAPPGDLPWRHSLSNQMTEFRVRLAGVGGGRADGHQHLYTSGAGLRIHIFQLF